MAMKVTSYYHRTNPDEAGYSLGNFYELWSACFEAAGVRSVIEVGAERGRLTQELLRWAAPSGARVTAIEPEPISDLLELVEEYPDLEIVEETSLDALNAPAHRRRDRPGRRPQLLHAERRAPADRGAV